MLRSREPLVGPLSIWHGRRGAAPYAPFIRACTVSPLARKGASDPWVSPLTVIVCAFYLSFFMFLVPTPVSCLHLQVGNFAFQRTYDAVLPMHWRIMLSADLIVTLPKMMYCHVGKKVVLTSDGQIFLDPNTLDTMLTSGPSASFVYHRKAAYLLAFRAWSERHHGSEKCGLWDWPYTRDDVRRFGHAFRAGAAEAGRRPISRELHLPSHDNEKQVSHPQRQGAAPADADSASVYYDVDDDDDEATDESGAPDPVGDIQPAAPGVPGIPSVKRMSSHHGMRAVGKVMTPLRRSYANRLAVLDAMVDAIAPAPSRPVNAVVVARWARLVRRGLLAESTVGGSLGGTTGLAKDANGW